MWTYLLSTLLLLQSIAVQAQLPPRAKNGLFTQIACDSITQTRQNQLALFDGDHKPLPNGVVFESCSLISGPCKIEGFSNVTVGPYTVVHPNAIFGPCQYTDVPMEITTTDGFNTVRQQLFASCELSPFTCKTNPPSIGEVHEVKISEFPTDFKPISIVLKEYNKDGCPADQNLSDQISNTLGCNRITNPGITNVVVVPKPDMPSGCLLTLYSDANCFSTSNAVLGPITPGSSPGSCIGPLNDSKGNKFVAQAAILKC
ncbi:hypothetical protein B9Z19DRAFT_1133743 [Tuber borchii]|uniref:Uncharacterized protein n=1 Tax=Tuber borchii TaxID=42251 RepID=A0A2T6ZFC6_TUBBO|nr:hypothetical protein B9Z19DRAFT_1133743 [Tuber borchii]